MKTIEIRNRWNGATLFACEITLEVENMPYEQQLGFAVRKAVASNIRLSGAKLSGADLLLCDLSGADLRGADLSRCDLSGADLRGADLRGAAMRDTNLRGAALRGAAMRDTNLRGSDLSGADLRGASLRGSDLRGANTEGTNLRGSDLQYTYLEGTSLQGADLRDADLRGADLRGNLEGPVAYPIGPGEWRPVPIGNVALLMEIWQQNRHCEICTVKWGVFDPAHPNAPSKRLS
jgi:uncharacterized protein YjbI with pentapeptide repeats